MDCRAQPKQDRCVVGVISDTHGLLRSEAVGLLGGVSLILHAGDAGGPEILDALAEIAPVEAVRGNIDMGGWAHRLPESRAVEIGGVAIYLLHDRNTLGLDPAAAGFNAVVSGHSHRPSVERAGGVLYVNPGSAGRRRFSISQEMGLRTFKRRRKKISR